METEIWKDIIGYNGRYKVSSIGRIKSFQSFDNKIISTFLGSNNYINVNLCMYGINKLLTVHRIIAMTFIPNPENKPCVNHINGIKTDNRVENLEWCTYSENIKHAFKIGLKRHTKNNIFIKNHPKPHKGKFGKNNHSSKSIIQFTKENNFIRQWNSMSDIRREIGIENISSVCNGRRKYAGGYIWKFKN